MNGFSKKLVAILSLSLILVTGCDDDFGDLNTNPSASSNLSPEYLLNYIWTGPTSDRYSIWRSNLIICSSWSQQLVSGFGYDTYNSTNDEYTGAYMDRLMPTYMAEAIDIIEKYPETAIAGMALVFKVHFMHRLVDMHGMIPYSEAFRPSEILTPGYDEVSVTYNTMIEELRTARSWIQGGQGINPGEYDPLYGGNLSKWEKFANSMILRLGLRLSEVEPGLSQQIVQEAVNAGVFESNDDMAWINYSGGVNTDGVNASGIGEVFQDFGVSGHLFRYSDVFVSFISDHSDPRETTLMATYDFVDNEEVLTNAGPGGQQGLRAGEYGVVDNVYDYAQPRRDVMVTYGSPALIMTYSEVALNIAEARFRGWIPGDAATAYNDGVRGAMKMLALYPNAEEISDEAIATYLEQEEVTYTDTEALRLINTQKWVALLFDGYEAYANYRRIGFPELQPVAEENRDPLSDGSIPKRVIYPISEVTTNTENYNRAIEIQGTDDINTRLWWDVN